MDINSLFIKIFAEFIGEDRFGNKYYALKGRRYVIYQDLKEPTKIPPMWHAWLHHLSNEVPTYQDLESYDWQKSHLPNLTGTKEAYQPIRKIVSSDYQPWKPN